MSVETVDRSASHTIEWNPEVEALEFAWNQFAKDEQLRTSLDALHEAIATRGADRYLVDTREIQAHQQEDEQWIAETWIPRLIDDGVRYGASVYPESTISDMEMKGIEEEGNSIDDRYTFRAFQDRTRAIEWLGDR
jgi:hypothetical protein